MKKNRLLLMCMFFFSFLLIGGKEVSADEIVNKCVYGDSNYGYEFEISSRYEVAYSADDWVTNSVYVMYGYESGSGKLKFNGNSNKEDILGWASERYHRKNCPKYAAVDVEGQYEVWVDDDEKKLQDYLIDKGKENAKIIELTSESPKTTCIYWRDGMAYPVDLDSCPEYIGLKPRTVGTSIEFITEGDIDAACNNFSDPDECVKLYGSAENSEIEVDATSHTYYDAYGNSYNITKEEIYDGIYEGRFAPIVYGACTDDVVLKIDGGYTDDVICLFTANGDIFNEYGSYTDSYYQEKYNVDISTFVLNPIGHTGQLSKNKPNQDAIEDDKVTEPLASTTEDHCYIFVGGSQDEYLDADKGGYKFYCDGKFVKNEEDPAFSFLCRQIEWVDLCSKLKEQAGLPVEERDPSSGCDVFGSKTLLLIEDIYDLFKFAIPILIIILSIVDFLNILLNSDEKNYKAAWNKLVKRIIIGVVILILPAILSVIIELSGITDTYGIDNIFCIFE